MAKNDAVVALAARVATGVQASPEEARSALAQAGIEESEWGALAATSSTAVNEFEHRTTTQFRDPLVVSEDILESESKANDTDSQTVSVPVPQGTGSNDPAVNVAATGEEPFSTTEGIGTSGQVASPEEYREDESDKGSDKKTTKAKSKASA